MDFHIAMWTMQTAELFWEQVCERCHGCQSQDLIPISCNYMQMGEMSA